MSSVRLTLLLLVVFIAACASTPEPPPPPPPPPPAPVAPPPPPPDPTSFKAAVFFDAGDVSLDGADTRELSALAKKLAKFPKRRVHVVGYTDPAAGDGKEAWLAERRAKSVAAYLVSIGIPDDRVTLEGSENSPLGIGNGPNQRVVEVTVR